MLLIALGAILLSVAVYAVTGGRFVFFALPLLLCLPLLNLRKR
jgi:hypothetical protein